jgi:hypothetical protein
LTFCHSYHDIALLNLAQSLVLLEDSPTELQKAQKVTMRDRRRERRVLFSSIEA